MPRYVRDDPLEPDAGFAELYASLPEATDLEPWLTLARQAAPPVLYLGVGAGRLGGPLVRAGVELVGVDAHPAMLAAAAERMPGAVLLQALIEELELGRRFELVMAPSNILNTRGRLQAAARHLAPDGRLAFELMNPHWLAAGAGRGVRVRRLDGQEAEIEVDYPGDFVQLGSVELVWPEAVEDFLAGAGLELVRMEGGEELETSPTFLVVAGVYRPQGHPAGGAA